MLAVAFRIAVRCVVGNLIFKADYVILAFPWPLADAFTEGPLDALFEGFISSVAFMRSDEQMVLDPVLDPAISTGRDAPVEHQLKIAKRLLREKVLGDAWIGVCLQAAVFDAPAISRRCFRTRIVPAVHGPPVEKQHPAGERLFVGQCVWQLRVSRATRPRSIGCV